MRQLPLCKLMCERHHESAAVKGRCFLPSASRRRFYLSKRSASMNRCKLPQISLDCALYKLGVEPRRHTTELIVTDHRCNSHMNTLLSIFISLYFFAPNQQTNFGKHLNKLCEQRDVDFERGIMNPFNDFLNELPIEGTNIEGKYLNYLNYLVANDQQHQILNMGDRYWSIKNSLTELGIIQGNRVNYESLIKLLKKTKPKDRVIKDILGVFKEIERNDYNVSSGLIADGIVFALNGATLDNETYQQVAILTVSAFAVMQNNGL
jgi:hypothetical protein